jgi:hypothetical protein
MALFQRLVTFASLGGLLGSMLTLAIAPRFITWFQAPAIGTAMCNCVEVSQATASQMMSTQLAGMGAGSAGGIVVGELIARVLRNRRKPSAVAATA